MGAIVKPVLGVPTASASNGHIGLRSKMCKPRAMMPQIDTADYPTFLEFATASGVLIAPRMLVPQATRIIQCPNGTWEQYQVRPETLNKPVLLSNELFVLDGNTRRASHIRAGSLHMPSYVMDLDLVDSLKFIWTFPKAYADGQGLHHRRK